ncbi:hypothetical protein KCP74_13030 [Salmonella enterica subsp. enterica]|nr:hypothetical protein KCP74_13030 [Salmonella enterica subsp. enterica]
MLAALFPTRAARFIAASRTSLLFVCPIPGAAPLLSALVMQRFTDELGAILPDSQTNPQVVASFIK